MRRRDLLVMLLTMAAASGCGNGSRHGADKPVQGAGEVSAADLAAHDSAARVLFIGNSYLFMNRGVDKDFAGLARVAVTKRLAEGGYTLELHSEGAAAREAAEGKWDFVVLQEQSQTPVMFADHFTKGGSAMSAAAKSGGAKPVFLATWERPDSAANGVTTEGLAKAYEAQAARDGALLVHAGRAFAAAMAERPASVLYGADGHPTPAGTYLAACAVYAVVTGKSPVGAEYTGGVGDRDTALFFQRKAAEAAGMR